MVERERGELGTVVALNDRRHPLPVPKSTQRRHDILGAEVCGRHLADAFPRVQVDNAQHGKGGAIGELIVDEVHRPALVRGV